MKRVAGILLAIVYILTFVTPVIHAQSGAFLIMDARSYTVLEEENGNARLPMASTTKIMTALIVLERSDLDAGVKIPPEAVGVEGSSLYLKAGEEYTVHDLLYALLLQSANDCAVALALFVSGDLYGFTELMNRKAEELGLKDTHFANPHGLPAEDHYSSAYDMGKLLSVCMQNSVFREITATKEVRINGKIVQNHNRLLSLYEGCIGGKTGYTKQAGRCLVSAAEQQGVPLACVTLGRSGDWEIHSDAYRKWFSFLHEETLAEKGALRYSLPIAGGGTVEISNPFSVSFLAFDRPDGSDAVAELPRFLYGNKEAGDVVGTVVF